MQSIIHTPRLILIRLHDTTPHSQHLQWYHENWSDPGATSWSLRGASGSLDESRSRMEQQLREAKIDFYAVFARPSCAAAAAAAAAGTAVVQQREGDVELGALLGSVSLRCQKGGPTLAPVGFGLVRDTGTGTGTTGGTTTTTTTPTTTTTTIESPVLRILGYAMFEAARGQGYATEANRGLLDAYAVFVAGDKAAGRRFYVEACVDEGNGASKGVLGKLGFEVVGWKDEEERVFLNGEWRDGGCWVWGLWV